MDFRRELFLPAFMLCALAQTSFIYSAGNKSAIYMPAGPKTAAEKSLALPTGPHLFLDELLIASSSNLTRRVNVPIRDPQFPNPIVTGREDGCFQPYMTVLRDLQTGRFRLWYGARTADYNSSRSHIGYLESEDGLSWIRPHRVLSDPAPIQFGVSVLDEGPDFPIPSARFKYAWHGDGGLRVATSPDGLRWTPLSPQPLLRHNHDINGLFWDRVRNRYLATVSFYLSCPTEFVDAPNATDSLATRDRPSRPPSDSPINGPVWLGQRRVTMHSVSTNLVDWREPWFVLTPDDALDFGETQFYAMDGYLQRGDLLIGMVKVLRDDLKADSPPDPPDAYGIGYTTLAWSHDGEHWVRDREPFFDRAREKGAWDHAHAWIDEQVLVGDKIFLYYGGYKCGHKVNRFQERQIGLVKIKRDRYVAREAGPAGGSFKTPLLTFNANAITLNANAQTGEIQVQLLGPDDKPLPGFTKADCQTIRGDQLAAPVRWKKKISTVKDQPVRFEFFLRNARLYAFELSGLDH